MLTVSLRGKAALAGALIYAGVAWFFGAQGRANKPAAAEKAPAAKEKAALTPYYYASEQGCGRRGCHESPPNDKEIFLCRCDEYNRWKKWDKHADAAKVLSNERSRRMGKLLGYDVSKSPACLACHGAVIKDPKTRDKNYIVEKEGVSCSVCHGPYKEWYVPHKEYGEIDKWRKFSREDKETKYGMTDLWDPVKRAALCASCHVGNAKQGKFVTHDMYAAGHPPLPGFEVGTFSDEMPRHWQYLREKKKEAQELLQYDGKEREQAKLVLVGAAVNLGESMRLLAQQAKDSGKRGLDLANFDCYACHHDLKTPSWRQRRGFAGKPGRVPMRLWPTALVKLAIRHAAANSREEKALSAEYARLVRAVQAGFDARPYGVPAKIAPEARALAKWADNLADRLNKKKPCEASDARKVLLALPGLYKDKDLDYDSARQVAWAFKTMYEESLDRGKRLKAKADPKIAETLDGLGKQLKLKLPSGRGKRIDSELDKALERLYNYTPDPFRSSLRTISTRLGPKR
jgi:hypothetical protein